jgi:hypothetical protein
VPRTRRGDHATVPFWGEDSGVLVLIDRRVDMDMCRFLRTSCRSGRRSCDGARPVAVALDTDANYPQR